MLYSQSKCLLCNKHMLFVWLFTWRSDVFRKSQESIAGRYPFSLCSVAATPSNQHRLCKVENRWSYYILSIQEMRACQQIVSFPSCGVIFEYWFSNANVIVLTLFIPLSLLIYYNFDVPHYLRKTFEKLGSVKLDKPETAFLNLKVVSSLPNSYWNI